MAISSTVATFILGQKYIRDCRIFVWAILAMQLSYPKMHLLVEIGCHTRRGDVALLGYIPCTLPGCTLLNLILLKCGQQLYLACNFGGADSKAYA